MTDLNVSLILRLVDKATAPARAAMRAMERLGGEGMMRQAAMVSRGSHLMASGLGTMTGAAIGGVRALTDYRLLLGGLGMAAIGRGFVNTAAEFENFNVQLANLEGSSDGAKRAMNSIENFATRTPLQMDQTVAAYAKLKAFGIDPMNGTLQALVDTMAATGGGAEKLDGIVLAVGQAFTKGKLQGEEAMQLLERGVPVYDLLAKKMGKTTEQIIDMQAKGKLGREEIELLVQALGEANRGASENMSKTWDGVISNLWDFWSKFQRQVMGSGLFVYLKGKLKDLLDMLNRMAANGDLQRWAETVGAAVQGGLEALWQFGVGLVDAWQTVAPWINLAAEAVGGFGNAALILMGLNFAGHILGLALGFARLGAGALWIGSAALPLVAWAIGAIGTALKALAILALAHPLLAVAVGLAAVAIWAYRNWDKVVAVFGYLYEKADRFFKYVTGWSFAEVKAAILSIFDIDFYAIGVSMITALWDGMKSVMEGLVGWAEAQLATAVAAAALLIYQNWDSVVSAFRRAFAQAERLFTYLTGWTFADVTAALRAAFDIDFYAIGVSMITALWDGMKSVMEGLVGWAEARLASITPAWLSDGFSTGSVGDGGYGGMGGAMGDGSEFTVPDGQRATGGPVRAGLIYRWNEQGRELFSPATDGTVINARQTRALAKTATTTVNLGGVTIHAAPGMSPQDIARAVRREMEAMTRNAGFGLHDGGSYA